MLHGNACGSKQIKVWFYEEISIYVYSHEDNQLNELKIVKLVSRTDDIEVYDKLVENEDVLLEGESKYNADTSAEFITDNDCYLVWFKYV